MKKIPILIFGAIIIFGLILYCCFVVNKKVPSYSSNSQINIQGIAPYDLANAPVPELDAHTSDESLFFDKGHIDLKLISPGFYIDMSVLGYTLMDNIPTAVALVSEKSGGTGYFPSIVLYQSPDKISPKIITTAILKGDRISIKYINISQNKITLIYRSWSENKDTKVNLVFENGKLISK
jgi:hypothetical protein